MSGFGGLWRWDGGRNGEWLGGESGVEFGWGLGLGLGSIGVVVVGGKLEKWIGLARLLNDPRI